MGAIAACRTAALGGHVEACDDCGLTRVAYNTCRNRHCPKCQGAARAQWLAARRAELLPVPYFHVVFTLPAPIAAIAFQNKAILYAILFAASAEAMTRLASNPRRLGARIGGITVLHTWGQTLTHHPHVHCIVPGGASHPTGRAGSPGDRTSSSPSSRSQGSFAASSSNACNTRSMRALCGSSVIKPVWPSPRGSTLS